MSELLRELVEKQSWNLGAYIGCPETTLKLLLDQCDALRQQLATARARVQVLEGALEFYADPSTYHACAFRFDRPTGGFDDDFDTGHDGYDRPMPGKAARAALFQAQQLRKEQP